MKIRISVLCFSVLLLLPIQAFSVYDYLSVDIRPTDTEVQFCFNADSPVYGHTYLGAILGNEIYFISKAKTGGFQINPWTPGNEPPIFIEDNDKYKPVCIGSFPKDALQNVQLYAGVGSDLADVGKNGRFAKIFSGYVQLPQPSKAWTVMVYMVGSDLEKGRSHWASQDISEMLTGTRGAAADNVNMVVTTGGSDRYGWQTIKRNFVHNGQQDVIEDIGSKVMADPQTLTEFVVWAKKNFPAQHYGLILWDHGAGTNGYGKDTSDAGKGRIMSLTELSKAYQNIRSQSEKPLDIVVYDACLMGSVEVAEVTSTVADAMAGSAELEPGHGIDYAYLLNNMNTANNGIDLGRIVKNGYIQQSKDKGSYTKDKITYSVFDLTRMSSFRTGLSEFSKELNYLFKDSGLLTYEVVGRGVLRAPGYPLKQSGSKYRSLDQKGIFVDLNSLLRTAGPDLPNLHRHAQSLLTELSQLVVDYEGNIQGIDPYAGRVSLDISANKDYLSILPEAYTTFNQALTYYNQRRKNDTFTPDGEFKCPGGFICADAKWFELMAADVLGVDGYYGQQTGDISDIYLTKSLYQYQEANNDSEIGVNGNEACQYQLCVNDASCENITLTEVYGQLVADLTLNGSPAILTFCKDTEQTWSVCSVSKQTQSLWGRSELLYPNDRIVTSVTHLQNGKATQTQSKELVVGESSTAVLKKSCNTDKAAIFAAYYGLNGKQLFELLCNKGDCVCKPNDSDESCKKTNSQFKAGVRIKK